MLKVECDTSGEYEGKLYAGIIHVTTIANWL